MPHVLVGLRIIGAAEPDNVVASDSRTRVGYPRRRRRASNQPFKLVQFGVTQRIQPSIVQRYGSHVARITSASGLEDAALPERPAMHPEHGTSAPGAMPDNVLE